ncbi:MAG: hypothetical protein R8P61_34260 [Bacteroidia bacterium]|nr:hypothetical protein [Bacteroidia bacterium]
MTEYSKSEISQLLVGFIDQKLTKEQWTHEAHLIVGCHYCSQYSFHETLIYLRSGIIALNVSMGVENTADSGYHESLTVFWIWVISSYIQQKQDQDLATIVNGFLNSPLASKKLPLEFYSKDCLFQLKARARFVEPDILPFKPKNLKLE